MIIQVDSPRGGVAPASEIPIVTALYVEASDRCGTAMVFNSPCVGTCKPGPAIQTLQHPILLILHA